jgi:5-methylcytosine-specific restriction protein A
MAASPNTAAQRNPTWSRDELILALDLYFRHNPVSISKTHAAVVELSVILNKLGERLGRVQNEKFRNSNGVYMKLCNFLRLDPQYKGTGLQAGGKLEEEVWKQFSSHRGDLRTLAHTIMAIVKNEAQSLAAVGDENEEQEFCEGAALYRTHLSRERSRELVRRAKETAKARHGWLACQACGFDFCVVYGTLGDGYIECHHTVPVSELSPGSKTRVEDIALLCANCHRMVHRRRPWLRMGELQGLMGKTTAAESLD